MVKLWGYVCVCDCEYKVIMDILEYDVRWVKVIYCYGGKIENIIILEVFISCVGYFYLNIEEFFFWGNVVYKWFDFKMIMDIM